MIGLASRQALVQAIPAVAAITIVAIIAAVTGPHLAQAYHVLVAGCGHGGCGAAAQSFASQDGGLRLGLGVAVIVFPALAGMFWGAPLVARELETGTFRLAWTQSVTRTAGWPRDWPSWAL